MINSTIFIEISLICQSWTDFRNEGQFLLIVRSGSGVKNVVGGACHIKSDGTCVGWGSIFVYGALGDWGDESGLVEEALFVGEEAFGGLAGGGEEVGVGGGGGVHVHVLGVCGACWTHEYIRWSNRNWSNQLMCIHRVRRWQVNLANIKARQSQSQPTLFLLQPLKTQLRRIFHFNHILKWLPARLNCLVAWGGVILLTKDQRTWQYFELWKGNVVFFIRGF